jgi:microsomal dipeptidase-like Zn-dependent dipeptidase
MMEVAMSVQSTPEWKRIHEEATIVDLHAHPSLKVSLFKRALTSSFRASRAFDPLSVRTDYAKLKDGAVDVLLSCIYAPEVGIYQECSYLRLLRYLMPFTWRRVFSKSRFEVTLAMLDQMEAEVEKAVDDKTGKRLVKIVRSSQELDELLDQDGDGPVALIHAVEGAHSLDGKLDNLEQLFDRGVAYMTIAHFYPNEAVCPTFPFPESVQKFGCYKGVRNLALGLTEFGEELVERMMELGVILDIAHCTPPARERIYEIVGNRRPIIASHVGAYAINPSAYNLKDWEMRKIADSGGVVGIIFMNYWLMPHETKRGLNFIAQTINHCVNVAGIDHVGIGTDFDGFTDPPDDLKDASELGRLTQRLIAEGYHEDQIGKIWGDNALRVLREGWGSR